MAYKQAPVHYGIQGKATDLSANFYQLRQTSYHQLTVGSIVDASATVPPQPAPNASRAFRSTTSTSRTKALPTSSLGWQVNVAP